MNWFKDRAREFLDGLFRLPTRIKNGYRQFFDTAKGSWQWVHRRVAEIVTGKSIPSGYEVHHVNRDKRDNDPENLQVVTKEEHKEIHSDDYKERVDRINKKLNNVIVKTAKQHTRDPKVNLQDRLNRIINAETVRVNQLFSEFITSGSYRGSCTRCGGTGYLPQFSHVAGGVCFLCGGSRTIDSSSFENFEPDDIFIEDDWEDSHFDNFDDNYYEPYDHYDDPSADFSGGYDDDFNGGIDDDY